MGSREKGTQGKRDGKWFEARCLRLKQVVEARKRGFGWLAKTVWAWEGKGGRLGIAIGRQYERDEG